jgi:hypothetical protein
MKHAKRRISRIMKISGQDADKDQLTRIHRMLEAEERTYPTIFEKGRFA